MANNIHQYGNGDNIAGDKVMGNKVGNQISSSNIGNVVNEARDNAQVNATNFTQTTGTSTAELLQIVASLRQTLAQFPPEHQEDLVIDINDVEEEIKKPENERNMAKLKKRLTALATAVTMLMGSVAAANQFIDEVTELGSKVGIELQLPPAQSKP